jgi:Uma2 family endonuclease
MNTSNTTAELVERLTQVDGKAEIVGGEIVRMSPTGDLPSSAGGNIYASLRLHAKSHGGRAYPENVAYMVDLPGRQSFSPDASYSLLPRTGMKFLQGAPVFAAEVRSGRDRGIAAERRMAAKRADYFAAGTVAVWDVDLEDDAAIVRLYVAGGEQPVAVFGRGQMAHAEPAVTGWTMPVDELFE